MNEKGKRKKEYLFEMNPGREIQNLRKLSEFGKN